MSQPRVFSDDNKSSAAYRRYLLELFERFCTYRQVAYSGRDDLFEPTTLDPNRSPVFTRRSADENVSVASAYPSEAIRHITSWVPPKQRHRWFRSMRSSQALTQSVFGTVSALNKLHLLNEIKADDGLPAFGKIDTATTLKPEHEVTHLGERRRSSIDVWVRGACRVAIECKFTEQEFGTCSRPRLRKINAKYEEEYCDGSYTRQRGREERCALAEIGIRYWTYVPQLFRWGSDADHPICPIRDCYQLVRNVLASCVAEDGRLTCENAHVLVLYDDRNPSYWPGGKADGQWRMTMQAIRQPDTLRRCTWQRLLSHLSDDLELRPLLAVLSTKYGMPATP